VLDYICFLGWLVVITCTVATLIAIFAMGRLSALTPEQCQTRLNYQARTDRPRLKWKKKDDHWILADQYGEQGFVDSCGHWTFDPNWLDERQTGWANDVEHGKRMLVSKYRGVAIQVGK